MYSDSQCCAQCHAHARPFTHVCHIVWKSCHVGISSLLLGRSWVWREADVEREAKGTAYSRDAPNNVGAIDGAAVPDVGSSMGSFGKNVVGTTIVGSNGNGFAFESAAVIDNNYNIEADIQENVLNKRSGQDYVR